MVEATLICIDNSEWGRNEDYGTTRFRSQQEAANMIANFKTNSHGENCVGILTMGGERVLVRITPSHDLGAILSSLHGVKIKGKSDFVKGIQTAQLALKHRPNKNQKKRIICFVASPVCVEDKKLEMLGKQLKKNNVSLSIVSIGDVEANSEKLRKLYNAVDSHNTSNFLEYLPATGRLLSDMLINSPLLRSGEGETAANGAENAAVGGIDTANEFGVDPNLDPDLYMALRISMEEEQARANRAAAVEAAPVPEPIEEEVEMDDELRAALELSLQDIKDEEPVAEDGGKISDPGFVEMLGNIDGVDVKDKTLLDSLRAASDAEAKDGSKKEEKEEKNEKKDENK